MEMEGSRMEMEGSGMEIGWKWKEIGWKWKEIGCPNQPPYYATIVDLVLPALLYSLCSALEKTVQATVHVLHKYSTISV